MKVLILGALLLSANIAITQQPDPALSDNAKKVYSVTPLEEAELASQANDLIIYQQAYNNQQMSVQNTLQQLQSNFMNASTALDKKINEVKKAHNIPDDVQYNKATFQFEKVNKPAPVKQSSPVSNSKPVENKPASSVRH